MTDEQLRDQTIQRPWSGIAVTDRSVWPPADYPKERIAVPPGRDAWRHACQHHDAGLGMPTVVPAINMHDSYWMASDSDERKRIWLGQCPRCRTIYWDVQTIKP